MKIAVKIVGIGPVAKGDGRHIEPGKSPIRLVEHVDANFFLDHVALVAKIFIVDFQCVHAVSFEPEDAFQSIGGNRFVIVRDVVHRRAVQHAAAGIDQLDVLHLGRVFGSLEHHVLEKMREAAAPLRLQAESDLVIDADGDNRRGRVRRDHHAQAVFQRGVLDGNLQ